MKNIKIFGAAIFITMLLVQAGCSEDPVAPTEKKPIEALAGAEIGSGGGTVETEDVSITIPPGALGEKHNIAIYGIADDGAFGENTVSSSFKISGLPKDYTKPIKIKMKYTEELGGQSFIAVGINSFDIMSGDTLIAYNLFPASDSSGFLIGELPAFLEGSLVKTNNISEGIDFSPIIKVLTKYTVRETEHFKIHYPIGIASLIGNVEQLLESSLNIINNDLGVSFYPRNIKQTIIIKYTSKKIEIGDLESLFNLRSNIIFYLNIDHVIQQKFDELKISLGERMFFIESRYGPGGNFINMTFWLYYATSSWLEEIFTDNTNFQYPTNFQGNAMAPFNGMPASVLATSQAVKAHGYGMSSVIKYLTEYTDFGKAGIGKAYNLIAQGADPVTALINNTDIHETEWLPDFFKKYVNGEIYNQPIDYFLGEAVYSWDINNASDTSKVFSSDHFLIKSYPDLSAKMFKINLKYSDIDSSAQMLLSMKWGGADLEGLSLIIFGINNGKAEYLGTANAQDFEIPNLKDYYDSGIKQFLVVLVNANITSNNYMGNSNIDLKVKVTGKEQNVQFNRCTFNYYVTHNIHYEYRNSDGVESADDYTQAVSTYGLFEGSLQGNVFTGNFQKDDGLGNTVNQTVAIELNSNQDVLNNFSITHTEVSTYADNVANIFKSLSGSNLSETSNEAGRIIFSVEGVTTCNYITASDFTQEIRYESGIYWNTQNYTTTSWGDCDEFNRIEISFWKE